jgi:hypothetical protein
MADSASLAPTTTRQTWIATAVGVFVVALFFRHQIQNGFTFLSSDRYDGVIVVALLEHWFNVLRGLAAWNSPHYFFPYPKTLGYNDGYFLYGLVYSGFRGLSIDPFLSSELVNVVVKAAGFAGFLLAARRMLKLSFWWALLGAALFTLANNSYVHLVHAQMLSVAFVPIEALLMFEAYHALAGGRRTRFLAFGCGAALLFAAWLMTSVYTAWFFGLFMSIFVGIQLVLGGTGGIARLKNAVLDNKLAVAAVGAVAIAALLPFVSSYMMGPHGLRSWEEVAVYSPSILDSVNVGANNLLFGDLITYMKGACPACDIGSGEREAGMGPLLFVLAAMAIGSVVWHRRALPLEGKLMIGGLALACAATWLIAVRSGHHTAWYYVYWHWPGGTGLRVVARIFLFLSAPAAALAAWYLSRKAQAWPKAVVIALCGLLLAEEINGGATGGMDRLQGVARIASVQPPPQQCRAFYATESADSDTSATASDMAGSLVHNIDAMLVAEYVNLPTINGHSSFVPADWNFGKPARDDYQARVEKYASDHGIAALCRLDLTNMHWDTDLAAPRVDGRLAFWDFASGASVSPALVAGFDNIEPFGRWSIGPRASFSYTLVEPASRPRVARIALAAALVKGSHAQRVLVSVNGGARHAFRLDGAAGRIIEVPMPADAPLTGSIDFELPDAVSPKALGMGDDGRQLAIGVKSIEIR